MIYDCCCCCRGLLILVSHAIALQSVSVAVPLLPVLQLPSQLVLCFLFVSCHLEERQEEADRVLKIRRVRRREKQPGVCRESDRTIKAGGMADWGCCSDNPVIKMMRDSICRDLRAIHTEGVNNGTRSGRCCFVWMDSPRPFRFLMSFQLRRWFGVFVFVSRLLNVYLITQDSTHGSPWTHVADIYQPGAEPARGRCERVPIRGRRGEQWQPRRHGGLSRSVRHKRLSPARFQTQLKGFGGMELD